jgi:SAM-dependent methyltransferase
MYAWERVDDRSVLQFYDHLASDYHLIFADWKKSVLWQGEVLDRAIRAQMGTRTLSLLDCSCGIGTQAIGLSLRGYIVCATDLSRAAVERARAEASAFGVSPTFGVADFRTLEAEVAGSFDVIVSCDNALPHLTDADDLSLAVRNIYAKLNVNGLFLASIRDYDRLVRDRPRAEGPRVFDDPEGKRITFQVWDWAGDGPTYTAHQFILREASGAWQTKHYATPYRALLRHELSDVMREVGFSEIKWHMPDESGYYQPIVTARKY